MKSTSTISFKGILTPLPITQLRNMNSIESDTQQNLLQVLSDKYNTATGIRITNDYILHFIHIDEIMHWEEKKEQLGPYFTRVITEGKGDPLKYLSKLLITGRVNKNIVVIEIDDREKLYKINDQTLKFAIDSHTIYIN